ncbi:hypothetical protein SUDANB121_05122 [Nocardiopsis dassonvillei]
MTAGTHPHGQGSAPPRPLEQGRPGAPAPGTARAAATDAADPRAMRTSAFSARAATSAASGSGAATGSTDHSPLSSTQTPWTAAGSGTDRRGARPRGAGTPHTGRACAQPSTEATDGSAVGAAESGPPQGSRAREESSCRGSAATPHSSGERTAPGRSPVRSGRTAVRRGFRVFARMTVSPPVGRRLWESPGRAPGPIDCDPSLTPATDDPGAVRWESGR